ncbi:hypothetical protein G5T42_13675 [Microbacterium sp. 4R-513]|uniref:hypothetical protein n=1 Tax=Microbacterium sp. 4R-513 TaxID=2567934 RepID=UPI0013E105A8|nr:hypothetical protein [Microbacterium sp. 4R-513]QIG40394.1 hypothetical protein G5T42_13675 [Microbacterium sp. 4R-513]
MSVVDLRSGELRGPPQEIRWVPASEAAFGEDGMTVALGNVRARHPIWLDLETLDVTSESPVSPQRPPDEDRLGAVEALSDGTIAAARQRGVDIYDAGTQEVVRTFEVPGEVFQWSFARDDAGMLLTSGIGGIARLDPADGSALWVREDADGCESIVPVPEGDTFICLAVQPWEGRLADGLPTGRRFDAYGASLQTAEVADDGALVLVSDRPGPFVQRFPLDGTGPITSRIADGKVAIGGFADEDTIVTAVPYEPGQVREQIETLWDVESDRSVGPSALAVDVVARDVVARWGTGAVTPFLSDIPASRTWEIEGEPITTVDLTFPVSGGPGPLSFVIYDDWIAPFDPVSGRSSGVLLDFAEKDLVSAFNALSINEIPGQNRALVTWRDKHESQTITGVYDLTTGEEIVRGLQGDTASIPLNNGQIVSTSANGLRLSSPLLEPLRTAPKPIAAGAEFELSDDGKTLLLTGSGGVALYDAETLTSLGSTVAVEPYYGPGAYLSPSGERMVTDLADGILLWDLDPDRMVDAVCRMVGRDFTATEWRTYFGETEQTPVCPSPRR